ncbi:hypothetical protein GCM10010256_07860 [Streptomyces coeruleorubidus]|nr:hypothetical protein GCM10010256_07860 [Streptomyces coeruleorubidus]
MVHRVSHRVKAIFKWPGGSASIRDMDGSSDFCDNRPEGTERHNAPEGKKIEIAVCLYEKSIGHEWDCGYGFSES